MARYRKVETQTWLDATFRSFTAPQPNGQTLWLYLLCGPRTTVFPGLVVGREEVMASDLGWSIESFRKAFVEPFANLRVKVDWSVGLVVLTRAIFDSQGDPRESAQPSNPNILKHWAKAWSDVPECDLKDSYLFDLKCLCERLGKGFPEAFTKAFGKPLAKALAKGSPKQDTGYRIQDHSAASGESDHRPLLELKATVERAKRGRSKRPKPDKAALVPWPEGWQPSEKQRAYCAKHGIDCDLEVKQFENYCKSKAVQYADYEAGFWTRLHNEVKWSKQRGGSPAKPPEIRVTATTTEYDEPPQPVLAEILR